MLGHGLAQGGHHLAAQDDVGLDLRVAQVQVAVLEAGGLVGLPAAVDGEGELVVAAAAQDLDLGGDHLDVAGGELGILGIPLPYHALHREGGLLVDGFDPLHHILGLDHHLGGAVEVPEDDEGQVSSHLPDVFHPADDLHLLSHVLHAELVAGMGAGLHHKINSKL